MKKYKKCPHCGYTRKRQLKKGTRCPKCGYKPVSLISKLLRAVRKQKPYCPRAEKAAERCSQEVMEVVRSIDELL